LRKQNIKPYRYRQNRLNGVYSLISLESGVLALRVLLIGDLLYTHMQRWAVGLARIGIDLTVLSTTRMSLPGIQIISSAVPPWRPWRPNRWVSRWQSVFRQSVARSHWDLIHLHYPHPYSICLDDIRNYPLVISTWGSEILPSEPEPESVRAIKVSYLREAQRVIASSDFLADATAEYAGLDRTQVVRHYWGVDLDQFRPSGEPCDEPVIGFAKALTTKYGATYLIDALPRILKVVPQARLIMLGDGNLEAFLRQQAAHLGVDKSIDWVGRVKHSEMPHYYARMALSVMPSIYVSETLGVSALESQAMRVPVVASRVGGIPESVIDGETGVLVAACDAQALADAIVTLLVDKERRRRLGSQGRAFIERQFDWRQTLQNTVGLYREVVSERRVLRLDPVPKSV
jgi:glycosyltransferase involved in cell wall biosynthesis